LQLLQMVPLKSHQGIRRFITSSTTEKSTSQWEEITFLCNRSRNPWLCINT
jgi:hypothetical protein